MTEIKADIAAEALKIVNGERRATYGAPEQNFGRIATLQAAYMAVRETTDRKSDPLSPLDVAMLNILQKVARIAESPDHRDSYVDIVGYALCAAEIVDSPLK